MPPLVDAGFQGQDGKTDPNYLLHIGPSIKVSIGHFRTSGDATPIPKDDVIAQALVDTGASQSCIDNRIAQSLELPVVDKMTISGVGGPKEHNMYLAQIHIPDLNFNPVRVICRCGTYCWRAVPKCVTGTNLFKGYNHDLRWF